jgi:hypothetical protein
MTAPDRSRPSFRAWQLRRVRWDHGDGTHSDRRCLLLEDDAAGSKAALLFMYVSGEEHRGRVRTRLAPEGPGFAQSGLTKCSYFYVEDVRTVRVSEVGECSGVLPSYVARDIVTRLGEVRRARGC